MKHPQAQTEVARSMMHRLIQDMEIFAKMHNDSSIPKIRSLLGADILSILQKPKENCVKPLEILRELSAKLVALRLKDSQYLDKGIPFALQTANDFEYSSRERLVFLLKRSCGSETKLCQFVPRIHS